MTKAEEILNTHLWGVHKELLNKHWSFKTQVLEAINNALNTSNETH